MQTTTQPTTPLSTAVGDDGMHMDASAENAELLQGGAAARSRKAPSAVLANARTGTCV